MNMDIAEFNKLLKEAKAAQKPFWIKRSNLAEIVDRKRITEDLIWDMRALAAREHILLATIENDFLLVSQWYECDMARAYREEFDEDELEDAKAIARPHSDLLIAKLEIERLQKEVEYHIESSTYSNKEKKVAEHYFRPSNELENNLAHLRKIFKDKGILVDDKENGTLSEFFHYAECINQQYITYVNDDFVESSDTVDLSDDFSAISSEFSDIPVDLSLLVADSPRSYSFELPCNHYQLAVQQLTNNAMANLADMHERYRHGSDIRLEVDYDLS